MSDQPSLPKQARGGRSSPGSTHVIHFLGDEVRPGRGPFLRELLDVLVDGAQQATRLHVDGRSTAPGMPPAWLEQATSFEVVKLHGQDIVLRAPPLGQAAPQRFRQLKLFPDVDPARSCLDLFEDSLDDALAGREDSDRYDRPLMGTLESLGRLFRYGVEGMKIINGRTLDVNPASIETIRTMRQRTPDDRRVMLAGQLDSIRYSDRAFTLVLESGEALRGLATESVDPSELARLFGQPALVTGMAKFRPSGKLLRVEAEHIEPARGDVRVWSTMPRPLGTTIEPTWLRAPAGPKSGIAAIFGQWPGGDESEEQIRAALEEMS
ncbi:MAG TPA: hypothetical protein VLS89_03035 [Candidatus Nanopelagicales bacterium]|nr:hypothetical protein [Candidatus Nanopelagicales bacterium]